MYVVAIRQGKAPPLYLFGQERDNEILFTNKRDLAQPFPRLSHAVCTQYDLQARFPLLRFYVEAYM